MTDTHLWKFFGESDLTGYTVLIPSVAVGNVGQLTCDLLISSLKMKKIASVYSPALIPIIGYDPYDLQSTSVSISCEMYLCESRKLLVLQIRAPLVYKYAKSFLENIVDTLKKKQIKSVIMLTSSYAHEKRHISTSSFRFICTEVSPYTDDIKNLNWIMHEQDEGKLRIYGGGFASMFFEICQENSFPCLILYKYCSEGDNTHDAYDMIHYLNKVLRIFNEDNLLSKLVQPVSWQLLFGSPLLKIFTN